MPNHKQTTLWKEFESKEDRKFFQPVEEMIIKE